MLYVTFATLLIAAVSGVFSFYRQLQTLQKNSYLLFGYFKWIKDVYTTELAVSAAFYAAITLGIIKNKPILALVLSIALAALRVVIHIIAAKKENAKLAFTVRAKTLYVAAIVVVGVLVLISALSSNAVLVEICRTLCLLLSIVTPALTIVVWAITYPIKNISKRSKNKKEQSIDDNTLD